jgi:hypothetical protein
MNHHQQPPQSPKPKPQQDAALHTAVRNVSVMQGAPRLPAACPGCGKQGEIEPAGLGKCDDCGANFRMVSAIMQTVTLQVSPLIQLATIRDLPRQ